MLHLEEQAGGVRVRGHRLAEHHEPAVVALELAPRVLCVGHQLLLLLHGALKLADLIGQLCRLVALRRHDEQVEARQHAEHGEAEHDRAVAAPHRIVPETRPTDSCPRST